MRSLRPGLPIAVVTLLAVVPIGRGQAAGGADQKARQLARAVLRDNRYVVTRRPDAFAGKVELLASSPFIYYRAAAGRFYAYLDGGLHRQARFRGLTRVLANGDPHINGNTGSMRGRRWRLVDHDEAGHPAPFTVDPLRWATGIYLAAEEQGIGRDAAREMVETYLRAYVDGLRRHPKVKKPPKEIRKLLAQGRKQKRGKFVANKLDKAGSFRERKSLVPLDAAERAELDAAYRDWVHSLPNKQRRRVERYRPGDVVEKIDTGGGSRGLRRFHWALLRADADDPRKGARIIQLKEQPPSPARAAFGATPLAVGNEAERVTTMRRRQAGGEPLDGYTRHRGTSYNVIELRPDAVEFDIARIKEPRFRRHLARADGAATAIAAAASGFGKHSEPSTVVRSILADIEGKRGFGGVDRFVVELSDRAEDAARAMKAQHALYVGGADGHGALQILRDWLAQPAPAANPGARR